MTVVPVRSILGLGAVPRDRTSAAKWLSRNGISTVKVPTSGGQADAVQLSDLPEEVQRAYTVKALAALELDPGTYHEKAHAALTAAPQGMRAEAERKAGVMRIIRAGRKAGLGRAAVHKAVWDTFGTEGNSAKSLDRWEAQAHGVDPVNFAAVLLDGYKGGKPRAEISAEAWSLFEGGLKAAFISHRFMALYQDVKAVAAARGWFWPSYPTVMRHLKALPVAEQEALRAGRDAALKRLYQPTLRDSSGLRAMEWVVLDGRTVDVWVAWPDGRTLRPTVLGLVDQASGKVLDIEFAASENAQATAELERRAFKRFGAPDNLLTDNGAAFSGHLHAGQVPHKHRNKGNRRIGEEPPGIFKTLGFNLHFALPRNAQAKLMERKFADMSREIDTGPEFMGAQSGSNPGERPEGWGGVGLGGEGCASGPGHDAPSRRAAGRGGRDGRTPATDGPSTVQPDGRVRGKDGWIYGEDLEDASQDALLRFEGRKVWVGTNPLDRSEPAIVWNPVDDRLIHKAVHAVVRGAFDDAEGARHSARKKAHLRKQTKRIAELDAAEASRVLREYWTTQPTDDTAEIAAEEETVVQPNFKRTVRPKRDEAQTEAGVVTIPRKSFITAEMRENQRRAYSGRDG